MLGAHDDERQRRLARDDEDYLISGLIFLLIGLFGILTDRGESRFLVLGSAFLVIGFTRK